MDQEKYFDDHIPHRVNLLVAFRTRYDKGSNLYISREAFRDLHRCSKDICFIMTRFFCEEMGFGFDQGVIRASDVKAQFGTTQPSWDSITNHGHIDDLNKMYYAASKAVAHMKNIGVDHDFIGDSGDARMIAVVNWIEDLIKTHIYVAAGQDYAQSMSLPHNVMHK